MPIVPIHWRSLTTLDLPHVERIAASVHPDFFERMAVFAERQRLYPDGARFLEIAGQPSGYVLSHPWHRDAVPALDSLIGSVPEADITYYLHDLALLPEARGTGAGTRMVVDLVAHARRAGFETMSLVAVNASQGFWERQGFVARDIPALADKLASYEDAARYMTRTL